MRTFTVTNMTTGESQTYNGINQQILGSRYSLRVQEVTFYCHRELELAVCEAARYAKEQYDWPHEVVVSITDPSVIYNR